MHTETARGASDNAAGGGKLGMSKMWGWQSTVYTMYKLFKSLGGARAYLGGANASPTPPNETSATDVVRTNCCNFLGEEITYFVQFFLELFLK